jgi:uncharacterized protein YbjT (DUF2867 family)
MKPVLVTGPSGNVGREVVNGLRAAGAPFRVALLADELSRGALADADERVLLDFTDPGTFGPALSGVAQIFLMRPPQIARVSTTFRPFIRAAVDAGVQQVVLLSLIGAEHNPLVPHRQIEKLLLKADLQSVFLRCGFFMQNLSTTHAEDIRQGDIFIPGGDGKTSFVDVRDIGAVAVKALLERHRSTAYALTGEEALTYHEVAAIMTRVLGRPITYSNPSPYRYGRRMRQRGNPLAFVLVTEALYTITKLGLAGHLSPTFRQLMGRAPIRFEQFVHDYRRVWQEPQTR